MKFSEFKRMVLDETCEDKDTYCLFSGLFEEYNDNDDVDLEDLKDYIENLEDTDIFSEVAESLVDVFDSDLLEWFLQKPHLILEYADDAIRELGATDIFHILAGSQYLYFEELAYEIYDVSLRLVENLIEDTQE